MSIHKIVDMRDAANLLYTIFPYAWMLKLASLQGYFDAFMLKDLRKRVESNLRKSFSEEYSTAEIKQMVDEYFVFHRLREMQKILLPRLSPKLVSSLVKFEGIENLDAAIDQGKGVMLLGSHLNSTVNFIAIHQLRQMGYDVQVVMPSEGDPFAPSLIGGFLARIFGTKTILEMVGSFYAQLNIRPIVKSLSNKSIPMIIGDGFHSTGFVKGNLLNHEISITTGPMSVARITGSPVVPFFMVGPPNDITVVFKEAIQVENTGDSNRDLEEANKIYLDYLDTYIRKNISTWQHWEFDHILELMKTSLDRSLAERLHT